MKIKIHRMLILSYKYSELPIKKCTDIQSGTDILERLYANWRVIVLCVCLLDQTLFLARYDILFWLLRAHQKSVQYWVSYSAKEYRGCTTAAAADNYLLTPMRLCTSSARFVYARNAFPLQVYRERAESQTEPKHSSECCYTQQLQGEAHGKSKRVTSVSNCNKTRSRRKQASVHRAYIEHNLA
jgi:hypothetical protein